MTKTIFKYLIISLFLFLSFCLPHKALALQYELMAPSGSLTRGQNVQFTINIDTESATVNSAQIGMTYQTTALQYVSAQAGAAMNSINVEDQGEGKLLFTGTNSSGFSGKDVFATVSFTIIAQAPGSTELCTLWAPSPTSTQSTTAPSSPPVTQLPSSGIVANYQSSLVGAIFIILALSTFFLDKKRKFVKKKK